MDARARENLDLLSVKLRRAQADYEWACSRGDVEHASHFQIKIKGITAERDRLTSRMSRNSPVSKSLVA
jgi:hypothetical protein